MSLTLAQVKTLIGNVSTLSKQQRDIIAEYWYGGGRNRSEAARLCGCQRNSPSRIFKMLESKQDTAIKAAMKGQIPEIIVAAAKDVLDLTDPTVLKGKEILSMVDDLVREASRDGRGREFKDLMTFRQTIVDIRDEMPATKVDIERTLGPKGLKGMDGEIAKTLELFLAHKDQFPISMGVLNGLYPTETDPAQPADEGQAAEEPEKDPLRDPATTYPKEAIQGGQTQELAPSDQPEKPSTPTPGASGLGRPLFGAPPHSTSLPSLETVTDSKDDD